MLWERAKSNTCVDETTLALTDNIMPNLFVVIICLNSDILF